jgi:hypothetical protein
MLTLCLLRQQRRWVQGYGVVVWYELLTQMRESGTLESNEKHRVADYTKFSHFAAFEPPQAKPVGFWFLLRYRLRDSFAYPVLGRFMRPARSPP